MKVLKVFKSGHEGGELLVVRDTTLNILEKADDVDLSFCDVGAFKGSGRFDKVLFTLESRLSDKCVYYIQFLGSVGSETILLNCRLESTESSRYVVLVEVV